MVTAKLKRILLAEDNENDVELTLTALQECRLSNEVHPVRDGAEALDYIYKRGRYADRVDGLPCVILLDLKMPRVDGLEVLRQLKADPAVRHVPIVMLTSSREEKDLVQFVNAIRNLGMFWAIINEPPPQKMPG
jgi:CheY-like chemotaxis protein